VSTDNQPSPATGIEHAALRKLVYQLAGNPDPDDVNVVQAAEQAVDRLNELETRVGAIEGATGINLENAEYQQLNRAAKVKRVRQKLCEKAREKQNGRAAMDYNEVAALFDYHPSPGHAVDLAKAAAEYNEDTGTSSREGYEFEKRSDGNNRVKVDVEKAP
jgi:hypothetical protein